MLSQSALLGRPHALCSSVVEAQERAAGGGGEGEGGGGEGEGGGGEGEGGGGDGEGGGGDGEESLKHQQTRKREATLGEALQS